MTRSPAKLADRIAAYEARIAELERGLWYMRENSHHVLTCEWIGGDGMCDCGWESAREQANWLLRKRAV